MWYDLAWTFIMSITTDTRAHTAHCTMQHTMAAVLRHKLRSLAAFVSLPFVGSIGTHKTVGQKTIGSNSCCLLGLVWCHGDDHIRVGGRQLVQAHKDDGEAVANAHHEEAGLRGLDPVLLEHLLGQV